MSVNRKIHAFPRFSNGKMMKNKKKLKKVRKKTENGQKTEDFSPFEPAEG